MISIVYSSHMVRKEKSSARDRLPSQTLSFTISKKSGKDKVVGASNDMGGCAMEERKEKKYLFQRNVRRGSVNVQAAAAAGGGRPHHRPNQ